MCVCGLVRDERVVTNGNIFKSTWFLTLLPFALFLPLVRSSFVWFSGSGGLNLTLSAILSGSVVSSAHYMDFHEFHETATSFPILYIIRRVHQLKFVHSKSLHSIIVLMHSSAYSSSTVTRARKKFSITLNDRSHTHKFQIIIVQLRTKLEFD